MPKLRLRVREMMIAVPVLAAASPAAARLVMMAAPPVIAVARILRMVVKIALISCAARRSAGRRGAIEAWKSVSSA